MALTTYKRKIISTCHFSTMHVYKALIVIPHSIEINWNEKKNLKRDWNDHKLYFGYLINECNNRKN